MLIMDWLIVFFIAEIGFVLWIRLRSDKLKMSEYQERAFMGLCFGFSSMWTMIIISDYYINDELMSTILFTFSKLFLMLGVLYYIFYMEKIKIFIYKRFTLTKSYILVILVYIFIAIFFNAITSFYMFINMFYLFIFISYYVSLFRKVFLKKRDLPRFVVSLLMLLSGLILLFLGFTLTLPDVRYSLNLEIEYRLLGDIIQLIAIGILIFFLILVPSTSEFEWEGKIEAIILMIKNGLPIYRHSFIEDDDLESNVQVSGIITSMKMMLDTTLENKGVSIIEKKGETMIIMPGKKLYGIIICKEYLVSLQILLKNLINRVENLYGSLLNDALSNSKIFKPIENIVKDLFF